MKRKYWRPILILAGIALAIYLGVNVVLVGLNTPAPPPDQNGIALKGGSVRGNRITNRSWSFDYQKAQLSADGTSGTIEGVKDGIVFRHGKPYLKIAAARISVDTLSLNFTAIGKVTISIINDPDKRSFETDLVAWSNGSKQLLMQHESYLHSGDQTMAFSSISIDFSTDQIQFGRIDGSTLVRK
jgi:hypothetical protein